MTSEEFYVELKSIVDKNEKSFVQNFPVDPNQHRDFTDWLGLWMCWMDLDDEKALKEWYSQYNEN